MAISLRIIYWIPTAIFFTLNLIFKFIIFLLQHIGNAIVWINRQIIKAGDYYTTKAQSDEALDKFIQNIQTKNQNLSKKVKLKRGRR